MLTFFCALPSEAKPLIEHFQLKRDTSFTAIQVFSSSDVTVIVTGIGRIRAALACGLILGQASLPADTLAINLGICGANQRFPIGNIFLANKVQDFSSGKNFYSDLIESHPFSETALTTFDRVVTATEIEKYQLVDMEAAGFFEAAQAFIPVSQIFCLKVVSDHGNFEQVNKSLAYNSIAQHLQQIVKFSHQQQIFIQSHSARMTSDLSQQNENRLIEVSERLHLTHAQRQSMRELAKDFEKRHSAEELAQKLGIVDEQAASKRENKITFAGLCEELRA